MYSDFSSNFFAQKVGTDLAWYPRQGFSAAYREQLPRKGFLRVDFCSKVLQKHNCFLDVRWCSGKNLPANAGDAGDMNPIPGLGRSPGNGNPLQYSSLGNPMDR